MFTVVVEIGCKAIVANLRGEIQGSNPQRTKQFFEAGLMCMNRYTRTCMRVHYFLGTRMF